VTLRLVVLWESRVRKARAESRREGLRLAMASAVWRWPAITACLMFAGGCGQPEHASASRPVVYLSSEDPNEAAHIADFRREFNKRVAPRHPRAKLEVHQVQGFGQESIIAKLGELSQRKPAPIVFTAHSFVAQVVVQEAPQVPLVYFTMADPVALGVVDRPLATSTNTTGYSSYVRWELKHVELLRDAVPGIRRVGVISDSFWFDWAGPRRLMGDAPALLGVTMKPVLVGVVSQIDNVTAAASDVDAWYLPDTPFNRTHGRRIQELIAASGKPSIAGTPLRAEHAHLLAYVRDGGEPWARLADIVGLLLSGVRASDIPFDGPKRFRLMVSLPTARRLGIEVPRALLVRADEIIP